MYLALLLVVTVPPKSLKIGNTNEDKLACESTVVNILTQHDKNVSAKYQLQMTKHYIHTYIHQNVLYCTKALVIAVVLNTPFQFIHSSFVQISKEWVTGTVFRNLQNVKSV